MSSAVATQNNGESISSDGNYHYPVQHPHLDGDDYSYAVNYNPSLGGSVGGGYVMPPQQQYSSAPPTPDYPPPQLVSPFYAPHPDAASPYLTAPPPPHFGPPPPHQQQHEHHHHAAAAALPPQLPQFHHPSQQMFYGPATWPVVPSLHSALLGYQQQQQQQVAAAAAAGHYNHPPYPRSVSLTMSTASSLMTSDLPPRRGSNGGGRRTSSKTNNHKDPLHPSYGSLELNVFDVENYDQLVSALNLVKRNSKATLFDIDGCLADVACFDEASSRFIQKRLRLGTSEERSLALATALSSFDRLWRDQYGNFLIQGLFEFGSTSDKKELMEAIYGQDVVTLCLHMHGCRIIQKAVQRIDQQEVCKLVSEFHDKVLLFIHDPNGNHVIQRCIQVMSAFPTTTTTTTTPPPEKDDHDDDGCNNDVNLSDQMQFIIDDLVANIEMLSTHRYGCRVVQRAVEHCEAAQKNVVLDNIVSCLDSLIVDHYGNYVVQQVFVCGGEDHKAAILETLTRDDSLLKFSKHKYASNVVETVLMHGQAHHKEIIMQEILKDTRGEDGGYCCLIELSKNSIANYVVNRAIEACACEKDQQQKFIDIISSSRAELAKSPYAKYVLQRIDKASNVLNQEQEEKV